MLPNKEVPGGWTGTSLKRGKYEKFIFLLWLFILLLCLALIDTWIQAEGIIKGEKTFLPAFLPQKVMGRTFVLNKIWDR